MSDEDVFVHSILSNPDDDTLRLVFADWLEEHDRASHAELIRVQCELARLPKRSRKSEEKTRRQELAAREKELLRQPEFFPTWPVGTPKPSYDAFNYDIFKQSPDAPKLEYERGFITAIRVLDDELMTPEWTLSPWHTLLREGKVLGIVLHPDQCGFRSPEQISRQVRNVPADLQLDRNYFELASQIYQEMAKNPSLCRVTRLQLFETDLTDGNLGVLARSPLLTQLREVWLDDCKISLDAMQALVTSPSIKQLRELFMDLTPILDSRRGSGVGQLWELVASSPNMASLERLWIDPLDNKGATALLKSPHLKGSLRLCPDLWGRGSRTWGKRTLTSVLGSTNVKALRERYPGTSF
ncbi:TIGR02996 domain-containing protein [Frigoriglobus tundricola]|uniref:Repeat-companion domain protein n=1 Tax=Frigoriglobus tundricola TaxID=2774151 RepID=A0A6M5Z3V1_9BACT|nr:TIGR02996 domain-containing protein [Frigoriglobus tundricola]QJX00447.1 hypothetical protein FTUN_8077 [Frigoriglobus tundricola]